MSEMIVYTMMAPVKAIVLTNVITRACLTLLKLHTTKMITAHTGSRAPQGTAEDQQA